MYFVCLFFRYCGHFQISWTAQKKLSPPKNHATKIIGAQLHFPCAHNISCNLQGWTSVYQLWYCQAWDQTSLLKVEPFFSLLHVNELTHKRVKARIKRCFRERTHRWQLTNKQKQVQNSRTNPWDSCYAVLVFTLFEKTFMFVNISNQYTSQGRYQNILVGVLL